MGEEEIRGNTYAASSIQWVHFPRWLLCLRQSVNLWLTLYLVCQPNTRISMKLWTPHIIVQCKVLLCQDQIISCCWTCGIRQYPREDLVAYVKRSNNKALDCCDPVEEKMLVGICLLGMTREYRIFLENFSFPSFSGNNGSRPLNLRISKAELCKPIQCKVLISKRSSVTILEQKEGSRLFGPNRAIKGKQQPKWFPTLPPFPCPLRKATRRMGREPRQFLAKSTSSSFPRRPRKKGHTPEQCVPFRRVFDRNQDRGRLFWKNTTLPYKEY